VQHQLILALTARATQLPHINPIIYMPLTKKDPQARALPAP